MSPSTKDEVRRTTTRVDIKKTDYTIRDWEDTDKLKKEIRAADSNNDTIIQDIEEQGDGIRPVMHVLGRAPGGSRVHLRVHGVKPYFYIPYDEFDSELENDSKVTGWDKGYENIQGQHMVRVYTRIPGDVPKLRNEYDHHEADILFPNRFLIDAGIEGSIRVPTEHVTATPTDIKIEDIEDADYNEKTRVCFADIEVDDSNGFPDQGRAEKEIISITVYDNYREEYQIFLYHPELPNVSHENAKVRLYENEIDMLKSFVRHINIRDYDCITGWNFTDFDSRYIVNRLEVLGDNNEDRELSKSDISKLDSAYDDGFYGAKIKGMAVFDMLRGYKNLQFTELDSYSLEDVAQEELGVGKVKDNRGIRKLWESEPQKLVDYNVKDVELTVRLEQEQDIIKFYEEIANYVGGRLGEVVDASKAVDIKVLRAVNGKWAVPSAKNVETEKFEGAKVFDPVMGVKENIAVLDLASLYPMSMKTINAGPETKDSDGELVAPNGVRFSNEQDAVVVEIIDEMLEERQKYKNLRDEHPPDSDMYAIYNRKQTAVKVVMNCFSKDTDVVTPSGIRNITDIDTGDKVYSINPETHDLEVKEVTDTLRQKNQYGKLKHIKTSDTDFKITPNHRMFVENKHRDSTKHGSFIEHYEDLNSGYTYNIPSHNPVAGDGVDKFSLLEFGVGRLWIDVDVHGRTFKSGIPNIVSSNLIYSKSRTSYRLENIDVYIENQGSIDRYEHTVKLQYDDNHSSIPIEYDMDKWLEFIAWYVTEGCLHKVGSKDSECNSSYRGRSERVQITQKQDKYREEIKELVNSMGINYTEHSNGIDTSNSILFRWFKENCGSDSYTKKLPNFIFENDLSTRQYKLLLKTLIKGDGQAQNDTKCRYSTVSDELKEDIVRLIVLCGYKPKVRQNSSGIWRIHISKDKGSFDKGREDTIEDNGDVHCITVKDNNTLLAGRNGRFQWTGNTLYGVMGWDRFRLQDKDVGAAVTAVGREVIKFTQKVVKEMGYEVIYGDTDSVMVRLGPDMSKDEVMSVGLELEKKINKAYDIFAEEELNAEEHFFEIEFEKLYRRFFQAGKKKRYAGHVIWKEGKEQNTLDIVGFEYQRSDYSKVAKDLMEKVFDHILRGGDLQNISEDVNQVIDKLKNEEYEPDKFGIPASITQDFDAYETETTAVKGARYANEHFDAGIQPGDKPKQNYVKRILPDESGTVPYPMPDNNTNRTQSCCWMNYADIPDNVIWDWDEYIEKQIKNPIERILRGTGWSWGEVISGERQPRLDEYEFQSEKMDSEDGAVVFSEPTMHKREDHFSDEDLTDWEREEIEARKALEKTQDMLDDWDDEDKENIEIVTANMKSEGDGPMQLDDFM